MAGFQLDRFLGLRPRVPDAMLKPLEATLAQNCDFAYGELRETRAGFAMLTMSNRIEGIYTTDGLTYYTWPYDVDAIRSPMASDKFSRMYFTGSGGFRVANRLGTRPGGGEPSSSYVVGVPRPSAAPGFVVGTPPVIDETTVTFEFRFHYESAGVKYQEAAIAPSKFAVQTYKFTPPAILAATPDGAIVVVRVIAKKKSDGSVLFDSLSSNSALSGARGLYRVSVTGFAADRKYGEQTIKLEYGVTESNKRTRSYVYTYVNSYGEEGPPSPPNIVTCDPLAPVTVRVRRDAQTVAYAPITNCRIYSTPDEGAMADYFFVGELAIGGTAGVTQDFTYIDKLDRALLNEVIASHSNHPPPSGLKGLTQLPNGILMGWVGNELYFSEAYKPWAWPPQYVKTLPSNVVGAIAHGSGAVVTTRGHPHLVSGVSPDAMTVSRVNVDQAGVSKWAIAVVDGIVMYASHDGLVTLNGAQASLVQGQHFFTRDVWRQRYGTGLHDMSFAVWDGRLVVFSRSNKFTPFMIRFDEADGTMTDLPGFVAHCAHVSELTDQFYYGNGNVLYQFNGGTNNQAVWQSAEIKMPRPINFAAGQVVAYGTWTVELWAKQLAAGKWTWGRVHTYTTTNVDGSANFRLPAGFEAERYRVKVFGRGRFCEVRFAQSYAEFANA